VFEEASECGPTIASKIFRPERYLDVDPSRERRLREYGIGETGRSDPIELGILSRAGKARASLAAENNRDGIQARAFHLRLYLHAFSMSFRLREAGCSVETCFYMPYAKLAGEKRS
jgi:hypothetical protein